MSSLMKMYPGTVIAVLDKNNPFFSLQLKQALDKVKLLVDRPLHIKMREKLNIYGSAVVCERPDGYLIEGNIEDIQANSSPPFWDEPCTIVVRNHEDGLISNWRPSYVTFIGETKK